MNDIFIHIFNMSITSSYVIIAIIFIRFLIRKAPKKYSYLLWSAVGFRLAVPISFKSVFSMFSAKTFNMRNAQALNENTLSYVPYHYDLSLSAVPQTNIGLAETTSDTINRAAFEINGLFDKILIENCSISKCVWLGGFILILTYGVVSYIALSLKMRNAVLKTDNIYESDKIISPFILGLIFPKIYIPFGLDDKTYRYVISHEKCHLNRLDYYVKTFAFILLAVHWFNPLCWAAFSLMTKDMEMSCDEKVLSDNCDIKKDYSLALLSFAARKNVYSVTPLCFSESSVKQRITNALKFKKPKVAVSVILAVLCVGVIIFCIANPLVKENESPEDTTPDNPVSDNFYSGVLTFDEIENLLDMIESSPLHSSAPGDYINAHASEYNTLLNNPTTIDYIFTEFLKGGNYDLRGQIMRSLLEGIAVEEHIEGVYDTGQDYFDAFYNHNLELYKKEGYEFMQNNCYYGFKLLNMRGDLAYNDLVADSDYLSTLESTLRFSASSALDSGNIAEALQSLTGCVFESDIGSGVYIYKFTYNQNIYFTYSPNTDSFTIYYNDTIYTSFSVMRAITDYKNLDIIDMSKAIDIAYREIQKPQYKQSVMYPESDDVFENYGINDAYKPVLYKNHYMPEGEFVYEKNPEYVWDIVFTDKDDVSTYFVYVYVNAVTGKVAYVNVQFND